MGDARLSGQTPGLVADPGGEEGRRSRPAGRPLAPVAGPVGPGGTSVFVQERVDPRLRVFDGTEDLDGPALPLGLGEARVHA